MATINYSLIQRSLFICLALHLITSCKKDVLSPQNVIQIDVNTDGTLYDVLFINDTVGFIAGGDRYHRSDLLTTFDGGKTWKLFHFDGDAKKAVYKLTHVGEKIYAVGLDGKFITKASPQADWLYVQSAWWQWYESIAFPEANHGYIGVNMGFTSGAILQVDSFGNFIKIDSLPCSISDLCFSSPQTGYACGYGTILKTSDAGTTWQIQEIAGDNFKSICCIGDHIWAAGDNGSIIYSGDAGKSWVKQRNGNDLFMKKYHLTCIYFKDFSTGYATGEKGTLLKTTDGGVHWSEFEKFTQEDLIVINAGPSGSLWVAGKNGILFRIYE